jgi:hypothetical protein
MAKVEAASDICLRSPRATQGSTADDYDDDDDDDEIRFSGCRGGLHFVLWKAK